MSILIDALVWLTQTPTPYLVKPKPVLLFCVLKCWIKNYLINHKIIPEPLSENVLGFRIETGKYWIFFRTFIDIFIKSQYYFETTNKYPVIVDLGSHVGLSVLYFKLLYPNCKIIAVEANRQSFGILTRNINTNNIDDVELHNFAVSDIKGSTTFYTNPDIVASWSDTLNKSGEAPSKTTIKTDIVSKFISKKVDLLKIDIEGSELKLIIELVKSKKIRNIEKIIVEYHKFPQDKTNHLWDLLELIHLSGFKFMFDYFLRKHFKTEPAIKLVEKYGESYNMLIYVVKQ